MSLWHEELTEPIIGAAFEVQGVFDDVRIVSLESVFNLCSSVAFT